MNIRVAIDLVTCVDACHIVKRILTHILLISERYIDFLFKEIQSDRSGRRLEVGKLGEIKMVTIGLQVHRPR